MKFRLTVRLRLTLLYGGLFLLAGAMLLALNYALVRQNIDVQPEMGAIKVFNPALAGELIPAPGQFVYADPAARARALAADGAVVSAEELLEKVWDEHTDPFTNTVRVTVMNLRRKLGDPPVVETVIGSGYRV